MVHRPDKSPSRRVRYESNNISRKGGYVQSVGTVRGLTGTRRLNEGDEGDEGNEGDEGDESNKGDEGGCRLERLKCLDA